MADLSSAERHRLSRDEIVILKRERKVGKEAVMIEAAVLFRQSIGKVWALLSRTEDQIKYLREIKKILVLSKTPQEDKLEFTAQILMKRIVFRVCHRFDEKNHFLSWSLDKSHSSDLKEFSGFWCLYPFGESQTLARYGSQVIPRFPVPGFLLASLLKQDVRAALAATKKYIDEGGKSP